MTASSNVKIECRQTGIHISNIALAMIGLYLEFMHYAENNNVINPTTVGLRKKKIRKGSKIIRVEVLYREALNIRRIKRKRNLDVILLFPLYN